MGEQTKIQWCHHTFNPWWGCSKVTAGCKHCYAETLAARFHVDRLWGVGGDRRIASEATWREPLRWNRQAEAAGERRRVFCASMADVFERHADPEVNARLDAARARLWELIEATQHLDHLLLTKRPVNIGTMVPRRWHGPLQMPRNVWLGASVCGDASDGAMVHGLTMHTHLDPAVRFLSYEPAIGPPRFLDTIQGLGIDWIIVGGESGPGARPFRADWAREVIAHGKRTGAAVFVKQMGSDPILGGDRLNLRDRKGGDPAEWPEDLRVREIPEVE